VVIDFGEAAIGCVFTINNNAPFPFQGVYPDTTQADMAPLHDVLCFKVAREAEWFAPGWEAAGGEGGDAADRRAVVDAALALQMAPHGGFPPHFKMDEASAALEASFAPLLPAWSSPPRAHPGPAPAAFADAQNALSRTLPECPRSASAANAVDEHHPELCLRSLVFIEQLACPATDAGDPSTVLVGPLPGQPMYAGAPNTAENFQTKFLGPCTVSGLEPVPLRLLLGTAEVKRDAAGAVTAITPMPAPMGFESIPASISRRRRPPPVRAYASMALRPEECVNCEMRFTLRASGLHGAIRRPGPSGDLSLCNACGVAFKRRGYDGLRVRAKAMAAARRAESEARRAESEALSKSPLEDLVEAAIGSGVPRRVPTGPRMVRVLLAAARATRRWFWVCLPCAAIRPIEMLVPRRAT
jgi:hypothetical protein